LNVTEPPEIPAPVSVYVVIVPPGEDHVNGMVVAVGVPAVRFDGALGAVNAVIEAVVPPSDGPPLSAVLVRDWSVNVYAVPGVSRLETVYGDVPTFGKSDATPVRARMYDSTPVASTHVSMSV
jgi:hypothetical protein